MSQNATPILILFIQGCWEMRYGPYPYYGWTDFHRANAFYAHFLAAYPPESPDLRELTVALRLIVFALEQDPWTHAQQPPPQWRDDRYWDTGRPTDYMQMLNVSENERPWWYLQ